jgi:deazaflavin-dependent oxidoreductase (nitroreductase family)
MKLPRRLARFNKVVTNRIQGLYAWVLPPWAVILHRGRRSGREYRTPLLAFRHHQTLVIALVYGSESDWLRNLQAGGGQVVRAGRTFALGRPEVITSKDAAVLPTLSVVARVYCRRAEQLAIIEIGEQQGGFGPHRHVDR